VVIVQIAATNHSGDMRTLGRIMRGIERMEESGYTVERYEHYSAEGAKKYIVAVERTEDANDADFEQWLNSLSKKPAGSGQTENVKPLANGQEGKGQ